MTRITFKGLLLCSGTACTAIVLGIGTAGAQITSLRTRPVAATPTEVAVPDDVTIQSKADAITLKPGNTSTVLRSLKIKRRIPLATLQTNPVITLAADKVDLSPVLANPDAFANIARRMSARPALVQLNRHDTEVVETNRGLVIRQFMDYSVKTGVCSNAAKRVQLEQAGASCATQLTDSARSAAFANPRDPRFIPDRTRRAEAIAMAAKESAAEQADFAKGIASFRAMMQNPAERAKVVAELGEAEAARLEKLNDDQLQAELVDAADTQVEDVMFMPARGTLELMKPALVGGPTTPRFKIPPMTLNAKAEQPLKSEIYLTGFTLGRGNEWRRRVSVTVKTCVVGCKKTYYLELYAGFGYGFGLRFPIKVDGIYTWHREGDSERATISPVFEPIDGSAVDYQSTGLANDKVFAGKELVAQLNAYAGIAYKVPFHKGSWRAADIGPDLTSSLPAPFANGQFRPPAPGNDLSSEVVLDSPDLLAGMANYGFAGAKILPAVRVGVRSDRLRLQLTDNRTGQAIDMLASGQAYPLSVDPADHSSDFTIGYPEYNLAFSVTPGLAARLFVDVAIWSKHWDWPVWFPDMTVSLPPSGVTFSCHEGTTCARSYRYTPTDARQTGAEGSPPQEPIARFVYDWRKDYRRKFLKRCPELTYFACGLGISSVAQSTGNRMEAELSALPQYPSPKAAGVQLRHTVEAAKQGEAIILEHKVIAAEKYGKDFAALNEPVWARDCADHECRTRIHGLAGQYVDALKARQKANPVFTLDKVVEQENAQGNWALKARMEVQASQRRTGETRRPITLPRARPIPRQPQ